MESGSQLPESFHRTSERERLRMALTVARLGTFDWDVKANRHFWSPEMEELMGFLPGTFQGSSEEILERVHPEDRERYQKMISHSLENMTVLNGDFRIVLPNGEVRWISAESHPYSDAVGDPTRMIGICRDITESKRTEQALRATLSIRDEFLSIASHELKTPLTSMKLQVQMAQRKIAESTGSKTFTLKQMKNLVDQLDEGIVRLSRLVEEMLDSSRIATGELRLVREKFNLADAAKQAMSDIKTLQTQSRRRILFIQKGELSGAWDRQRITQVIAILLTNAIRYSRSGPIDLSLRGRVRDVMIEVHDTGSGIADSDQQRIFQRFERAISAAETSGMGLGLYIAKEIVEGHGGTIRVMSHPSHGTTFTVMLPKIIQQGLPSHRPPRPTPGPHEIHAPH